MALVQRAFASLRGAVLANLRIPASSPQTAAAPISLQILRSFADASYLDKNDVTDRVLNVVKHFDKVDAGKVRLVISKSCQIFDTVAVIGC